MPTPYSDPHYPCPTCKAPTTWQENPSRPFCSERCRMVDLGKWALEEYRLPGPPADPVADNDEVSTHEPPS